MDGNQTTVNSTLLNAYLKLTCQQLTRLEKKLDDLDDRIDSMRIQHEKSKANVTKLVLIVSFVSWLLASFLSPITDHLRHKMMGEGTVKQRVVTPFIHKSPALQNLQDQNVSD